jgi:hypothetical protein
MSNINLDINTYNINEMENLLKLKHPYIEEDLFNAKTKMQTSIIGSNITQVKKEELSIFLDNIYNRLSNNLVKIDAKNFNDVKQYDGNHFIIKNENDKYSSTLENNKQINKSIIKRTYTVDSLFRQNYDADDNQSHNYVIQLPETINKAITMSISSIEIPLTYHNISEELNNNVFHIRIKGETVDTSDVDISGNIELLTGMYESRFAAERTTTERKAASIKTEVNRAMNEFFIDPTNSDPTRDISLVSDLSNCFEFIIDINSGFGVFQFDPSKNEQKKTEGDFFNKYSITINFDVNNNAIVKDQTTGRDKSTSCYQNKIYQKLGWQLGFRNKSIVLNASNELLKESIIAKIFSRTVCYINYPRYIYIALDDFQASSRNYFSIASESIIAPNIIARINILSLLEEKTAFRQAAAPGDFIYNNKHVREYFGPTDITKLKVSILDEYGRPFTLNNMDWSFILSFECFYN